MNSIASKVWETLYPDRRPWDQLPEATQQEWSRMTDIVVDLTGARELRDALKKCAGVCSGEVMNKNGLIDALESARSALTKAKEVLG